MFPKITGCKVRESVAVMDLITFKAEVTLILKDLAKAVVKGIFTAAEKVSKPSEDGVSYRG